MIFRRVYDCRHCELQEAWIQHLESATAERRHLNPAVQQQRVHSQEAAATSANVDKNKQQNSTSKSTKIWSTCRQLTRHVVPEAHTAANIGARGCHHDGKSTVPRADTSQHTVYDSFTSTNFSPEFRGSAGEIPTTWMSPTKATLHPQAAIAAGAATHAPPPPNRTQPERAPPQPLGLVEGLCGTRNYPPTGTVSTRQRAVQHVPGPTTRTEAHAVSNIHTVR